MENTTNVANEVVENVAEEAVANIGAGTVITGICAATGAVVIVLGAIKGAKWLCKKVKTKVDDNQETDDSWDDETDFEEELGEEK